LAKVSTLLLYRYLSFVSMYLLFVKTAIFEVVGGRNYYFYRSRPMITMLAPYKHAIILMKL
jgi:hypothetical protein